MVLTIEYLQNTINETQDELKSIEIQLSSTLPQEDWAKLKTKTDKALTEYKRTIEESKHN